MVEHYPFKLNSEFDPQGDQPEAIKKIVKGVKEGKETPNTTWCNGTGKTFTMSNVIQQVGKPTLIIAHNKTLADNYIVNLKNFSQKIEWNIS